MNNFVRDKFFVPILIVMLGVLLAVRTEAQTFMTVYNFAAPASGTNNFGAVPQSGVLLLSNTLYGTTYYGGSLLFTNTNGYASIAAVNGFGTVYAVNTDGTGYTNLYNFTTNYTEVFTNYVTNNGFVTTNVYTYNTTTNVNGAYPYAGLFLGTNNVLYGTTSLGSGGGSSQFSGGGFGFGGFTPTASVGSGTIFAISLGATNSTNGTNGDTNGTNGDTNGTNSGTNDTNGTNGLTDTNITNFSNFTNVYSFPSSAIGNSSQVGGYPVGALLIAPETVVTNAPTNALFGTVYYGGAYGYGSIYAASIDGNPLTFSYSTNYTTNYSTVTNGSVVTTNTNVMTNITPNTGLVGSIHDFAYTDGGLPEAGLLASSNTFYGTTTVGGTNGNGVVFSINNNSLGYQVLYAFSVMDASGHNIDGALPRAGLILSGTTNTLYGTASEGGAYGYGTIFAVNTDGTGFTNLYSFSNGTDGAYPYAGLVVSNNTLYGTASQGGSNGDGTVFAINTDGTGFATVYTFTATSGTNATNSDGAYPVAGLTLSSNNTLYGTAALGGTNGAGTVYSIIIPSVYTLSVSASPAEGGVVSGGGSFPPGSTNIVTAMTNTNYSFVSWTVNGNVVSTNSTYPVTLNGNISLVANFSDSEGIGTPTLVSKNGPTPKQFQSISFPAIASKTYGAAPFTPDATASSGLPVVYKVSGPATLSTNNVVTITGAGTVVLSANQSGSTNYFEAKQVTVSFKVNKAPQTITFPVIPEQTLGKTATPLTVVPVVSSGLKASLSVKGPAKLNGDTVIFTSRPGTVVLQARQAGNSNYLPAPVATTTIVVQSK